MKHSFVKFVAVLLIMSCACIMCGCFFLLPNYDPQMPVSSILGSPLVQGKWAGDTFINEWSGFTVTLPTGFWVAEDDTKIQGEYALDFLLYHNNYPDIVISLAYFDVTQGERREHAAEDYLRISGQALEGSPERDFFFNEYFEDAAIAGWEFKKMSGTFVNIEDKTHAAFNIDRHAHRWLGTMVVIVAMYADENADIVNDFLSSIERTW